MPTTRYSHNEKTLESAAFYNDAFGIDRYTGSITVENYLDYSKLSFYQYLVFGTDGGGLKGSATLIILIQDIQNKRPYFTGLPFNAVIPEESAVGTTVNFLYPIRADDGDTGVPHAIEFIFTEGMLDICRKALEKVSPDETNPGPSNSTAPVVITIRDNDDNLPAFRLSMYNATVFENVVGIPLTIKGDRIYVTDVDELVASEVRAPAKRAQCTVHLTIIDRNDNLPQFTKSLFVVHIPENNTNVQQVLSEHATDKDSGLFGEITYSLRGGGDIFKVDNVTGRITKRENRSLDYEKRDEYILTFVAKDGGGRLQLAEVIVRLIDVNDNPPVFTQSSSIGFVEETVKPFEITVSNFLEMTVILYLTASDRDMKITNNSRVEFILLNSPFDMQRNFTISTITRSEEFLGSIALIGSLDYEQLNETTGGKVILYVLAKDFGNPSLSSTCTVTINVQDLNDNTPEFNPTAYKERIFENATFGDYVGNVTATDEDGTNENKDLSYYIIIGSGLFRINGQSGVITVNLNAEFDRETTSVYNLTIVAVDRGTPPRTGHTHVTVVIDDVNDTPPKFDKDIFFASVLENTTVGYSVQICSATDQDLNFHLLYKIVNLAISKDDNRAVEVCIIRKDSYNKKTI
ncbi:unnamed protein product [Mytilus edulis]|uniref:Cadherin domain-containing protein n=1 Tax=Mytilus edulis TaxID=6550 RepID=A0A8S3TW92_MYTED|nr:unnamed protein product [Mytilus edulis]